MAVACLSLCEPKHQTTYNSGQRIEQKQDIQKSPVRVPKKVDKKGKWSTWEM